MPERARVQCQGPCWAGRRRRLPAETQARSRQWARWAAQELGSRGASQREPLRTARARPVWPKRAEPWALALDSALRAHRRWQRAPQLHDNRARYRPLTRRRPARPWCCDRAATAAAARPRFRTARGPRRKTGRRVRWYERDDYNSRTASSWQPPQQPNTQSARESAAAFCPATDTQPECRRWPSRRTT